MSANFLGAIQMPAHEDENLGLLKRLPKCSLQDLIAIGIHYPIILLITLILVCYLYDPTMQMLLYSALPTQQKNWLSFSIFFVEEARFLFMMQGVAVPVFQVQVISFDLINKTFQLLLESLENNTRSQPSGMARIQNSLKALRCVQLYVTILNIVNQNVIFTLKLLCLFLSIVCGYATIAHFNEYPIFGVMYFVLFVDASLIYMILYETAFKVPALFEQAKVQLRLRARAVYGRPERNVLDRQIMSIPPVGVKVGNFHMLERTSTPVFLDFVLTNIVSMLVVYQ